VEVNNKLTSIDHFCSLQFARYDVWLFR